MFMVHSDYDMRCFKMNLEYVCTEIRIDRVNLYL